MKVRIFLILFLSFGTYFICHADSAILKNKTDKEVDFILNSSAVPGCHVRSLSGCERSGGFRVKVPAHSEKLFRFRDHPLPCTRATCFGCVGAEIIVNPDKVIYASLDLVKKGGNKFVELTGVGIAEAISTTSKKDIWWGGTSGGKIISGLVIAGGTLGGIGSGVAEAIKLQCFPIEVTVSQIGEDGNNIEDYKIDIEKTTEKKINDLIKSSK